MEVKKFDVLGQLIGESKKQFVVPVYQRNYSWERENCEKLFDDIVAAYRNNRTHFLSTIIYVNQGGDINIPHNFIIDGQQRITTIFLLLKALHDAAESEELKENIRNFIFNKDELTPEDQNKIRLADSDNGQFADLMQGKLDSKKKIFQDMAEL